MHSSGRPEKPEGVVEELQLRDRARLIEVGRLMGLRTGDESAVNVQWQIAPCQRGNVRTIVPPLAQAQIDLEAVFLHCQVLE
jgi:hypothetical protein